MALQISLWASPSPSAASRALCGAAVSVQPDQLGARSAGVWRAGLVSRSCVSSARLASIADRVWRVRPVRSSLEIAGPTVGTVTEVNKDTFWPLVKSAGGKVVVLDMYTQWCGPCKVMAPKFQELSQKYVDAVFLKLDCNQENKPLAKELGIRVVPTFKILKDGKVVKEVTGAKFDDLVLAIETSGPTLIIVAYPQFPGEHETRTPGNCHV